MPKKKKKKTKSNQNLITEREKVINQKLNENNSDNLETENQDWGEENSEPDSWGVSNWSESVNDGWENWSVVPSDDRGVVSDSNQGWGSVNLNEWGNENDSWGVNIGHSNQISLMEKETNKAFSTKTRKPREMEVFDNPNLFDDGKEGKTFYRTFGYWQCSNEQCPKRWCSAFTWVSLEKCQKETTEILLEEDDYWQQECNNKRCKSESNYLTSIKILEEKESSPHEKENCEKCKEGKYCNKAVIKCWGYGYGNYICRSCKEGNRCDNSLKYQEIKLKIKKSKKNNKFTEWKPNQHDLFKQQITEPLLVKTFGLSCYNNQQLINSLIKIWIDNKFTYSQVQDWVNAFNIHLQPDDAEFCAWLRDVKKIEPRDLIIDSGNVEKLKNLRNEYKESDNSKEKELEQLIGETKEKLNKAERYLFGMLIKKNWKSLEEGRVSVEKTEKLKDIKDILSEKLTEEKIENILSRQAEIYELEQFSQIQISPK